MSGRNKPGVIPLSIGSGATLLCGITVGEGALKQLEASWPSGGKPIQTKSAMSDSQCAVGNIEPDNFRERAICE